VCRYRYKEKFCAHRLIKGRECVGEEHCQLGSGKELSVVPARDCDMERWYGLYCSRYQRFFCPGPANCKSVEDYMLQFMEFRQAGGH